MSWTDTFYWVLGYDSDEVKPTEKTIKQRHLVMKQIKDSKMRLRKIKFSSSLMKGIMVKKKSRENK